MNIPAKKLMIGDRLYAISSWNSYDVTIVEVTENEAISDKGFHFAREFHDGDSYINDVGFFSLDFQNWMVIENKA